MTSECTAEAVISRIAEVAHAVGWQAGVGASETAGLIISVLAQHPNQIDRFMRDGSELFIDGTFLPERGCLSWHGQNGKLVTPEFMRSHLGVRKLCQRLGIRLLDGGKDTPNGGDHG